MLALLVRLKSCGVKPGTLNALEVEVERSTFQARRRGAFTIFGVDVNMHLRTCSQYAVR